MNEMILSLVGNYVTISTSSGDFSGKLEEVKDNWVKLSIKEKPELFNIDYISRIRIK